MTTALPKVPIMTTADQGQFIEATIQSVLHQTYPNTEYIIVDGDSTDTTMAVIGRYGERHRFE